MSEGIAPDRQGEPANEVAIEGAGGRDAWLTPARVRTWLVMAFAATVLLSAIGLYTSYVDPLAFDKPVRVPDFGAFYVASQLTLAGDPVAAYDPNLFFEMQKVLVGPGLDGSLPWVYPPTAMLFAAPLALIPLWWSFAVWLALQCALYGAICWRILSHPRALLAAFVGAPMVVGVVTGNSGILCAALMGFMMQYRRSAPWLSGIALGLATFKPHVFILVPVAFLIEGIWKPLPWATGVFLALVAGSLALGGVELWQAFIGIIQWTADIHTEGHIPYDHTASLFLYSLWLGFDRATAMVVHGAAAIPCAVILWLALRNPAIPPDLKAAFTVFALYAIAPRMQSYELSMLFIGILFQVRHALAHGWFPGEKTALAVVGLLAFLTLGTFPGYNPFFSYTLLGILTLGRLWPVLRGGGGMGATPAPRRS